MKDNVPLDSLASELAIGAGQVWQEMTEFPGYKRTVWRDQARVHLRKHEPDARIECSPPGWDGKDGVCFIRRG